MTAPILDRPADLELISRCLARENDAWDALVAKHLPFVQAESRRQLLRFQGRPAASDLEDACQEVFSLLMRDGARVLRQFRGESSLPTWLARVVRSVCRGIADRAKERSLSSPEIVYPPPSEDDLPPAGLEAALRLLPPRDEKLLRLFFYEGKKYRQIAQELRVSVNSVGPLLSRAIQTVRRLLPG